MKVTGRTWVPDRGGSRLDAFPLEADLSGPIASVRVRSDCAYACSVRWQWRLDADGASVCVYVCVYARARL